MAGGHGGSLNPAAWPGAAGRAVVRLVDLILERVYRLFYFSDAPDCVLRLSWVRARAAHAFADGTVVRRGDRVANIHLWNERLPRMPRGGPDLAWGRTMHARLRHSLRLLAAYAEDEPTFAGVEAFWGEMAFAVADADDAMPRLLAGLGFEVTPTAYGDGLWGRCHESLACFYAWLLMWLYNPASLKGKSLLGLRRHQLWLSRRTLRERYWEHASY